MNAIQNNVQLCTRDEDGQQEGNYGNIVGEERIFFEVVIKRFWTTCSSLLVGIPQFKGLSSLPLVIDIQCEPVVLVL